MTEALPISSRKLRRPEPVYFSVTRGNDEIETRLVPSPEGQETPFHAVNTKTRDLVTLTDEETAQAYATLNLELPPHLQEKIKRLKPRVKTR